MPELRLHILDDSLKVVRRPVEKEDSQYAPISLAVLMMGERLTFGLYLKASEEGNNRVEFIPYLEEGETLEPHWLEKLQKLGIDRLFLHRQDLGKAIAYLNNHLLVESGHQAGSSKEFSLLREHMNFSLQAACNAPQLGHHVGLAKKSLGTFFGVLQKNRLSWKLLLKIMYRDYTLYNHAVNVAMLGMGMGGHLRKSPKDCLVLGVAGLFHDLGLIKISEEITGKKEPLAPEEWEILKKHPWLGYRLLKGNPEIPVASLRLVLEHHENADGSGYPQGLELKRQHPLTSILALLEAYDGLTIFRPYRPRYTPFAALKILQEERGSHGGPAFEPKTLKKFIEFLALT
jgi:HD-GYP domain-containing protein (c-di-GMP phosphodiesterase class II)